MEKARDYENRRDKQTRQACIREGSADKTMPWCGAKTKRWGHKMKRGTQYCTHKSKRSAKLLGKRRGGGGGGGGGVSLKLKRSADVLANL